VNKFWLTQNAPLGEKRAGELGWLLDRASADRSPGTMHSRRVVICRQREARPCQSEGLFKKCRPFFGASAQLFLTNHSHENHFSSVHRVRSRRVDRVHSL
jgi:hypothetical protein